MIEKVEKLVVALTDMAVQMTVYYAKQNGLTAGQSVSHEAGENEVSEKPKRGRPKSVATVEKGDASPFPPYIPAKEISAAAHVSLEEQTETRKRAQELMGLYIRRHLKAVPPGLERAKKILLEECGRPIAKLEDLTHEDNVKLIPRFEAELEVADLVG